jgi:hypothetical protein
MGHRSPHPGVDEARRQRTALNQAYQNAGRRVPTSTDPSPVGVPPAKAVHMNGVPDRKARILSVQRLGTRDRRASLKLLLLAPEQLSCPETNTDQGGAEQHQGSGIRDD